MKNKKLFSTATFKADEETFIADTKAEPQLEFPVSEEYLDGYYSEDNEDPGYVSVEETGEYNLPPSSENNVISSTENIPESDYISDTFTDEAVPFNLSDVELEPNEEVQAGR